MNFDNIIKKYRKPSKKGFTLVELIVAVAIMAIVSGATLTVFLMVQDVSRDASNLTVDQYNTTTMERFLRNEFQTASKIDIGAYTDFRDGGLFASKVNANDEFMMFDVNRHTVSFARADKDKHWQSLLTIDDVKQASITISPIDCEATQKSGQNYKAFYKITTSHYEYSGGIVLGNCVVGDGSMKMAMSELEPYTLNWGEEPLTDADGNALTAENDLIIYFHREMTKVLSTDTAKDSD